MSKPYIQTSQHFATTILRFALGSVFFLHGLQKLVVYGVGGTAGSFADMGVPLPALTAVFATVVELLGGLALLLGVFTRHAAGLLAVIMFGALVTVHLGAGFFLPNGYEYVLVLLAGTVALALSGPGALALENVFGRGESSEGGGDTPLRRAA